MKLDRIEKCIKSEKIKVFGERVHAKASEKYIDVIFIYDNNQNWEGSVPIHYRRTGVEANTEEEVAFIIEQAYAFMNPVHENEWLAEQDKFWNSSNKYITKLFFEKLKDCQWKCAYCDLPNNPNWARRVQDLKEFGYTLSTDTKKFCQKCGKNRTQLIMLRIPKGGDSQGYEIWSTALRKRILNILAHYDVYEDKVVRSGSLLPDHKFPEIRWDENVKEENPDDMSDEKIRHKFQLLTNQRNQQKREVCRNCYQTGERGKPFGISFFYNGTSNFPKDIVKKGKEAEKGCIGCGWYDMNKWRKELNRKLSES